MAENTPENTAAGTDAQKPDGAENQTGAPAAKPAVNPGLEIARRLTPVGCILLLAFFVMYLVTCFTAGNDPLSGYKAPHDAAYYSQSEATMQELETELETNVLPKLQGVESCALKNGKIEITLAAASYNDMHAALTRRFDETLFTFVKDG